MSLNVLSLFDGISCARVALDRAGFSNINYSASEVDSYAIQVTKKNWAETKHLGDVRTVTKMDNLFLLIGGSPCQDLSVAKQGREGLDGLRSKLFFEYVRILKESKPRYFILENVASMSRANRDKITEILGVEPILIDAALVSAQSRERLFWTNIPVVGKPTDKGIAVKDILQPKPLTVTKPFRSLPNKVKTSSGLVRAGHVGVPKAGTDGSLACHWWQNARVYSSAGKAPTLGTCGKPIVKDGDCVRSLSPLECERLQGLPDNYTSCLSDSRRYHGIGNAFNVDVIAFILSFIPK